MKKYIYIIGTVAVVAGVYLIVNPSEKVNNPLQMDNSVKKSENSVNIKHNKTPQYSNIKTPKKEPLIHEVSKKNENKTENVSHLINKETLKQTSQKIAAFIANNNLQPVQSVGNVEIFAPNPPRKNEFAPPSPPTLIKLKFKDKSEIIPLKSDLIMSNQKVYVVEKKRDKYSQIKEIDTKKLTSFTPPLIGQN